MPRRTDTILHDMISEGNGGSGYHHLNLTVFDALTALSDNDYRASWIAPRAVRIINNRSVATQLMSAGTNPVEVFRNIGAGTDRSVTTAFDMDTTDRALNALFTPVLSTATTDNLPHVVANQYQFFVITVVAADATTGPFNITYMAHYSFEDI